MKHKIVKTLTACCMALACTARAEQGGSTGHYAPGAYLDFSGFPPSGPGWYVANYFLDYNNGTFGGSRGLPFGSLIGLGVTANVQAEAPSVVYALPFDFFGGRLSTGFAPSYQWVTVEAKVALNLNGNVLSVTRKDTASGSGDVQWIPLMAGWTNGDFSYGGLLNIWAPTGEYNKSQLANVGLGYWTFEPMLAFSWLSQKIGTEVSLFTAVDFNTSNNAVDYQSGDLFHLDATVAQHLPLFGGFAGVGASAFYMKQFTGDSGSGARLGGFQAETYGVGPTLSYIHNIGQKTLVVDGSWLPQLHSNNTTKGDFWWIKVTLAF